MQRSVRSETHFEQYFSLQLQVACLVGINRIRLERDLDRRGLGRGIQQLNFRSAVYHLLGSKASGRDAGAVAPAITFTRSSNAVAKIRAGHSSFDSFRTAG